MNKSSDLMKVAVGKWPSLLTSIGISEQAMSGKHSPCPICEGKDRFRVIEADGPMKWICNQCGSGDGMNLAQEFLGLSFNDVCNKLRPYVGGASYSSAPKKPNTAENKRRIKLLMDLWRSARYPEEVRKYLTGIRKLPSAATSGADLRAVESVPMYDDNRNLVGKYPCMLARIITPANRTVCLHRTYIESESAWTKKLSQTTGSWAGGAIRLFPVLDKDTMIVAEGIETAIAARYLHFLKNKEYIPAWATVTANGMVKFAPPEGIKHVLIMSDNDRNFTGQKAAYDLANRLVIRNKIQASVFVPTLAGNDWFDVLDLKING